MHRAPRTDNKFTTEALRKNITGCILILTLVISAGPTAFGQSKALVLNSLLEQLQALNQGVLLLPLKDMPEVEGIATSRDPKTMQIKEANQALINGVVTHFEFADVMFYFQRDSAAVHAGNGMQLLVDRNLKPITLDNWDFDKIFIAREIDNLNQVAPDMIIRNARREKRNKKKARKLEAQMNVLATSLIGVKDSVEFEKIQDEMVNLGKRALELTKHQVAFEARGSKSEFEEEMMYFSSNNAEHKGLIINRLNYKTIKASKNKSYEINWNYFTRLHTKVDEERKYSEAFSHLNQKLVESKTYLEKKLRAN